VYRQSWPANVVGPFATISALALSACRDNPLANIDAVAYADATQDAAIDQGT
jgi:hypothetical protein